jgi:hypothetical protein
VSEVDAVHAAIMSVPGVASMKCRASVASGILLVEGGWRPEDTGP